MARKKIGTQNIVMKIVEFDDGHKQVEINPNDISDLEIIGLGDYLKRYGHSILGAEPKKKK